MSSDISSSGLTRTTSANLTHWLSDRFMSLVFTTYQAGKIFLVELQLNGNIFVQTSN